MKDELGRCSICLLKHFAYLSIKGRAQFFMSNLY